MEMQTKVHKNVVKNNIKGEAVVGQVCARKGRGRAPAATAAAALQKIINIKRK